MVRGTRSTADPGTVTPDKAFVEHCLFAFSPAAVRILERLEAHTGLDRAQILAEGLSLLLSLGANLFPAAMLDNGGSERAARQLRLPQMERLKEAIEGDRDTAP